jgi:uncharacterized membrane protein YvbJ
MKCPNCGNDMDAKDVCDKCGKKAEVEKPEVEIEYKEFKLSEFLEIRKKQKVSGGQEEFLEAGTKIFEGKMRQSAEETESTAKEEKRSVSAMVLIILVIIATIACIFYLLRHFLK